MRKMFVLLLLALTALSGTAQTVGEAIYFYRNDGGFNAFFRADIDSITYTTIASDSTATDVVMVQNIHTPDSTYEIPLNVIDSVSFVNPETILQPDVIKMDATMLSYLQAIDGMTLVFSSSMPSALRPKEGDILLSVDTSNRLLSDGFAGRVTSVGETAGTLQVACARVEDVSDIFVQLIGVERIGDDHQQAQARRYSMGTGDIQRKSVTLPLNYDSEPLEDAEFALSGSLNGTVYGEYAYFFNLFNQVVDVTLYHEWDYSIGADFKIEKDFEWPSETSVFQEKTLFKFLFPLAAPVFKVELTGTPFVSAEGSIESAFNYQSRKYPYITRIKYEDKNGFQGSYTKPLKESGDENEPSFDAQISVKGSVMAGGKLGLSLGTIDFFGGYLRARADLAIGPKLEADIHLEGNTDNGWNNFYNAHKDNKLELGLIADIDIYGEANFWGKVKEKKSVFQKTFPSSFAWEWYLLPEFDNLKAYGISNYNTYANAYFHASRKCLFPVEVGAAAYDWNNGYLGSFYDDYAPRRTYTSEEADYEVRLEGLPNGKVTVRPVIKLLDHEIPVPSSTELIKVETLPGENNGDGTYTLRGKLYGGVKGNWYTFTYGETRNLLTGSATSEVYFVEASQINADGEYTATIPIPDLEYFHYAAAVTTLDYKGRNNWFNGEPIKVTIVEENEDNPDEPTPGQMVDLGLSVKWAGWDVGASSPEEYGDFYAWGETETKDEYTEENYSHFKNGNIGGNWRTTGLYCNIGREISGTQYDAARVKWGGTWRMPTKEEALELLTQCTKKKVTYKGYEGWLFTGPNGNKVFLRSRTTQGNFWTGTWGGQTTHVAWTIFGHNSFQVSRTHCYLYMGLRIRAVCD